MAIDHEDEASTGDVRCKVVIVETPESIIVLTEDGRQINTDVVPPNIRKGEQGILVEREDGGTVFIRRPIGGW